MNQEHGREVVPSNVPSKATSSSSSTSSHAAAASPSTSRVAASSGLLEITDVDGNVEVTCDPNGYVRKPGHPTEIGAFDDQIIC